jgi:hypothetical protein
MRRTSRFAAACLVMLLAALVYLNPADARPIRLLTISDAVVLEGRAAEFTVSVGGPSIRHDAIIKWQLVLGGTSADQWATPLSGTLVVPATPSSSAVLSLSSAQLDHACQGDGVWQFSVAVWGRGLTPQDPVGAGVLLDDDCDFGSRPE